MLRVLQDTQTVAASDCPVEVGNFLYTVGPVLLLAVLAAGLLSNNGEPIERRVTTLGTTCLAFFVYWFVSTEIVDQAELDTTKTEWLDVFRPITNSSGLAPYLKDPQNPNFFESILDTCIEYAYVFDGVVGLLFAGSLVKLGQDGDTVSVNPLKSFLDTPRVWTVVSLVIAFVHLPGVFAGDIIFGLQVIVAILASDVIHGLFGDIGKGVDAVLNFIPGLGDTSTLENRTHALLHLVLMVAGSLGNVAVDDNGKVANVFTPSVLAAATHYVAHSLDGDANSQLQSAVQLVPWLVQASIVADGLCNGDTFDAAQCSACGSRYETIVNLLSSLPWPSWISGAGLTFGAVASAGAVTDLIGGGATPEFADNELKQDYADGANREGETRGDGRVVNADKIRVKLCANANGSAIATTTLKLPTVSEITAATARDQP